MYVTNPELIQQILSDAKTLDSLISAYVRYIGKDFPHLRTEWQEQILDQTAKLDPRATRRSIFGREEEINRSYLATWAPHLQDFYMEAHDPSQVAYRCLEPSVHDYRDPTFPAHLNAKTRVNTRPGLDIRELPPGLLFASPHGCYQYFTPDAKQYVPSASSRAFSKEVLGLPTLQIDQPLVIITDRFDGTNFSHFLFDHVPRVMHWCKTTNRKDVVFLMSGVLGEFQSLAMRRLCDQYQLSPSQFIFPKEPVVYRAIENVYFFSNQKLDRTHPAHIGHPETVKLICDLFKEERSWSAPSQRVYVSRYDGGLRRVRNEAELLPMLQRYGFHCVKLAGMPWREQIDLFRSARVVVGAHGMGFTHVMFMKPGGTLLELFGPLGTDAYAIAAKGFGLNYRWFLGKAIDDASFDFHVEPEAFESALRQCLD